MNEKCCLFLKLCPEYIKQVVNRIFLEVGTVNQVLTRSAQYRFGGGETHILECLDYPLVNLVLELIQVDVFLAFGLNVTVNVDAVTREDASQLDVQATLTDSQRHFLGTQEHLGMLVLIVQTDR